MNRRRFMRLLGFGVPAVAAIAALPVIPAPPADTELDRIIRLDMLKAIRDGSKERAFAVVDGPPEGWLEVAPGRYEKEVMA